MNLHSYTRKLGVDLNPQSNVTVGVGCCQCLYSGLHSFISPGSLVLPLTLISRAVLTGNMAQATAW